MIFTGASYSLMTIITHFGSIYKQPKPNQCMICSGDLQYNLLTILLMYLGHIIAIATFFPLTIPPLHRFFPPATKRTQPPHKQSPNLKKLWQLEDSVFISCLCPIQHCHYWHCFGSHAFRSSVASFVISCQASWTWLDSTVREQMAKRSTNFFLSWHGTRWIFLVSFMFLRSSSLSSLEPWNNYKPILVTLNFTCLFGTSKLQNPASNA